MKNQDFIPYSNPKGFKFDKNGNVTAVEFKKNLPSNNDPEALKYSEREDDFTLDCDAVITAFGCEVPKNEEWLSEVQLNKGLLKINRDTN